MFKVPVLEPINPSVFYCFKQGVMGYSVIDHVTFYPTEYFKILGP